MDGWFGLIISRGLELSLFIIIYLWEGLVYERFFFLSSFCCCLQFTTEQRRRRFPYLEFISEPFSSAACPETASVCVFHAAAATGCYISLLLIVASCALFLYILWAISTPVFRIV